MILINQYSMCFIWSVSEIKNGHQAKDFVYHSQTDGIWGKWVFMSFYRKDQKIIVWSTHTLPLIRRKWVMLEMNNPSAEPGLHLVGVWALASNATLEPINVWSLAQRSCRSCQQYRFCPFAHQRYCLSNGKKASEPAETKNLGLNWQNNAAKRR